MATEVVSGSPTWNEMKGKMCEGAQERGEKI